MQMSTLNGLRFAVAGLSASLMLAVSGCTGGDDDLDKEPTPSPEPELLYYTIPTDPCAVIDLESHEALLGAFESSGPDYSDEDETITVSGRTHCNFYYNDGINETLMSISLELLREPAGEAAEQDADLSFGYWWAYTTDSANENLESVPEPIEIPIESAWESSQVQHFTGVNEDRLTWNPEGTGIAVIGTFTESNVVTTVSLTKEGYGLESAPEPEEYAETIVTVAEQLRTAFGPR